MLPLLLPAVAIAPFVAALAVPAVARMRRAPGLLMLVLSTATFAWLLAQWPDLVDQRIVEWSADWVGDLGWTVALRLDGLSHLFALLIAGIGALVAWYGLGYLGGDERSARFFFSLLLFQGGMLLAVLADDLVLLYVGWEVTSVTSFALIAFSHGREDARRSALHALLVTTAGGLAMLGGLILLTVLTGANRLSALSAEVVMDLDPVLAGTALVLIALGALTKSAQFPFHGWLPGAMSAPTPVSAYLHSATMVKLGVYLLARLQPSMGDLPLWTVLLPVVGGVTMLLGAVLAVRERDLKRVLAYSTISALGSMVMLAGLGTDAAMKALVVTVVAHACYKAALFMVAGTIDHETGTRDRLALGGLRGPMPLLAGAAALAAVSMAGLPPGLGFLSKETALAAGFGDPTRWLVVIAIAVMGALTLVAAWTAGVAPFFDRARVTRTPDGDPTPEGHATREAPVALWAPPALLAVAGIALATVAPGAVGHALEPAVAAAAGRPYEVHLALWEGWNRILVASIVAIAAGFALVPLHRGLTRTPWLPVRSDAVTQGFLDGLSAFAGRASRTMQHGSTPLYIATVLVFTAAPLAVLGVISSPFDSIEARLEPIPLVASVIVVVGAIAAANSETRFRSIAALGATGFGMTLVFLQFGAPDVAMTQALVETLTVVLFIFAFRFLPVRPPRSPLSVRVGAIVVAAVAGVATTAITLAASTAERPGRLRGFFEEASYLEAHGRNVVNTILVDFRALDTLGEITVLAAAALGILALLRITESRGRQGMNEVPMSRVLRTAARGLLPLIVMFAFFLFLRGHNEPGGGFVAGLVAAAAVTLYAIAYDTGTARAILRVPPQAFIAAGLLVAIGTAAATSLPGTAVLTGHWVQVSIPGSGTVELGSPVLFDVGVFLVVLGVASTLATALLEER